ncbi:hypothetical protein ACRALDRAFT_212832 [Sodiomyces alcalophilus JCM 7366]|uniref:uncharacterized protein n=1 Tax=Sodiomyces alcalophilus JCM 7366 TaxID=591952 RepID=UPI0039B383E4
MGMNEGRERARVGEPKAAERTRSVHDNRDTLELTKLRPILRFRRPEYARTRDRSDRLIYLLAGGVVSYHVIIEMVTTIQGMNPFGVTGSFDPSNYRWFLIIKYLRCINEACHSLIRRRLEVFLVLSSCLFAFFTPISLFGIFFIHSPL